MQQKAPAVRPALGAWGGWGGGKAEEADLEKSSLAEAMTCPLLLGIS